MNDFGVFIQARMESQRLPGKVLMKLGDRLLIDHVLQRAVKLVDQDNVFLLIPDTSTNDVLESYINSSYAVGVFRGSHLDVRDRFLQAALRYQRKHIVRITADDPFKDPNHIIRAIKLIQENDIDYYCNFSPRLFPIGLDVESFTLKALQESVEVFQNDFDREHVTPSMRDSGHFRCWFEQGESTFSDVRLTVDSRPDLEFCESVWQMIVSAGEGNIESLEVTQAALRKLKS